MNWIYGRCSPTHILWCTLLLTTASVTIKAQELVSSVVAGVPSGLLQQREGFFNRTSYVRLFGQVSLRQHLGLSFRTCAGGQLFAQRNAQQTLALEVLPEGLVLTAQLNQGLGAATVRQFRVTLNARFLDNAWHTVNILYRLGNLTLSVNGHQQVIANSTYNQELLAAPEMNFGVNNELHVGYGFVGCILEGPGLVFNNATHVQAVNVQWGPCPLTPNSCEKVDHCLVEPCMMHGQCISRPDRYQCHCAARYSGNNCEIDNGSPCLKNPCKNNGICQETPIGDYYCQCRSGFTGQYCDTEITARLCDNSPCKHGGTCTVNPLSGQYECQCPPGYTGRDCHHDINECMSTPCLNAGLCEDKVNGYQCVCNHTGYEEANCEININECEKKPWLNGVCFDNYGGYTCQCLPGFGGLNCEMNLNECASDPCQNNGTCTDQVGSYRCDCSPGFTGHNCQTSMNLNLNPNLIDCRTSPCPPHATCLNINATFMCVCEQGYFGDQCEKKMEDCSSEPCLHGGVCQDNASGAGFTCNCTSDYTGALCELVYDACSSAPCRNNATCKHLQQQEPHSRNRRDYFCQCPPGFKGSDCETNIDDCLGVVCGEGKQCVDKINGHECLCQEGWGGDNCSLRMLSAADSACQQSMPCKNNATCIDGSGYQCFCKPGYSGDHCDLDFDECLSNPCQNGAQCLNLVNNFKCICTPGYTGRTCDINIDECASNPCQNGATCIDGIDQFSCQCPDGLTGSLCETNIDDCEPQPCLHNGACIDGLNNYTCNCDDTGYEGTHCEKNIDDCKDNLCENGAVCEDQVKDYLCKCYPGYSGKNCEIDINECEPNPCQYGGTCLELSNATLYQWSKEGHLLPDGQGLPAGFQQDFSYAQASGYACMCVPGVRGDNCEENINECASNPCFHGKCHDLIDGYRCDCEQGYEGPLCNIDINECEQYRPCEHGECYDQKAGYLCVCDPKFGGKNCSVELTGCKTNACLNGGTCRPYLENETLHLFNCSCPHGYHGNTCQQSTTMSLTGSSSYIMANTTREEGYEIHFRFKTTLPNGLLALGRGSTFYFLELVQGKLNLHSSLLNKWEGVTIGSKLNDGNWQKVFVAINTSHLVLAANEEQTIYPINQNEGTNASHTSFPTTYIGGTISTLRRLPMPNGLIPYFVGCIQDIFVNGLYVLPVEDTNDPVQLQNVEAGCPRHEQCDPNPCHSGGHCTDLWRNFSCTCERPYLGHTCQYNLTAATFGHENTTSSLVTVEVWPQVRPSVQSILDISMFVRTRQGHGAIFYLGSRPNSVGPLNETLITARLQNGELQVSIQFSGIIEAYTVGGVRLDNGNSHLIQVVRNVTLVQVKINSTEYFRKTISATGKLDLQVLYLGGMPPPLQPKPKRQVAPELSTMNGFKGVIQDVQVSNGSQTMVVEFFPLRNSFPDDDIDLPPALGHVTFDLDSVLEGVVSDDTCAVNPCQNGGTCRVTWNDFVCECTRGHKGKQCEEMELCELKRCPEGSVCRNVDMGGGGRGYECAANLTLTGHEPDPLTYRLQQPPAALVSATMDSVQLAFRSRTGGTLLYVGGGPAPHFQVSALGDQVTVAWHLGTDGTTSPRVARMQRSRNADSASGEWTTVMLTMANDTLSGAILEDEDSDSARLPETPFSSAAWHQLLLTAPITVGGTPIEATSGGRNTYYLTETTDAASGSNDLDVAGFGATPHQQVVGGAFKGCIGQVRIGGLLLPFFTPEQLDAAGDSPAFSSVDHFALIFGAGDARNLTYDCLLCFQMECINGGRCANETESYLCDCPAGFTGDFCEIDINECENNLCSNGAVCVDGMANYTCSCLPGWEGWLCDKEIDECASSPCLNSGTCIDKLGSFECLCPDEYVGERCDQLKQVTCQNKPCRNNAACADVKNPQTADNFTCTCAEGFVGVYCETAYCVPKPCLNGGLCNTTRIPPLCQCERGFEGLHCEMNIDDCKDKPCLHNGLCIDKVAAFECLCNGTGYEGMNCEIDKDKSIIGDPCYGRGTCVNIPGSYRCDCVQGYCGPHCEMPDPCMETPCQNGGSCSPMCVTVPDFECSCTLGFSGKNCTESNLLARSNVIDIALIVGPVIAILLIAAGVSLTVFVMMARKKRATRGTYSPSSQEYCNPRVELDNVMKPPPEERLI
ncbi:hypothetical protein LSTR_LSTR011427 [Laodelphax striatellus]|uniref:Protein crumbs n=1 Tax=Laodelphax striatellus TaxID=195883 RepID=A0A482WN72_LAOST|nr:hypothetical protein LSTR_LSTR011427 [Laodelphax striatellus]